MWHMGFEKDEMGGMPRAKSLIAFLMDLQMGGNRRRRRFEVSCWCVMLVAV